MKHFKIFLLFLLLPFTIFSETVYVKYRGLLNLERRELYECPTKESSLEKRIVYDSESKYLVVKLNATYYHYCGVSSKTLNDWLTSPSLGKYYIHYIKNKYDCRKGFVPSYK
jgi:hypothetical protein